MGHWMTARTFLPPSIPLSASAQESIRSQILLPSIHSASSILFLGLELERQITKAPPMPSSVPYPDIEMIPVVATLFLVPSPDVTRQPVYSIPSSVIKPATTTSEQAPIRLSARAQISTARTRSEAETRFSVSAPRSTRESITALPSAVAHW